MQQLDRTQGIGCSDIPAIMGVSPWSDPYKKWEEKVFGKEEEDNPAMKYGRETESLIRELTEKKLGVSLSPKVIFHPKKSWLWASLDGFDQDNKIIAEFKTAKQDDHLTAIAGEVPEKYWPQIQGQMEVVGVDHLFYCSYHQGDLEILKVARDKDYCKVMMEKVEEFWEWVVLETPPEGYICMKGNQTWNHLAEEINSTKAKIKAFKEKEEELTSKLKELSKGYSSIGTTFSFMKEECDGCINYEAAIKDYIDNMKAHHPEISFPPIAFDPYRKKSFEKWRLKAINKRV